MAAAAGDDAGSAHVKRESVICGCFSNLLADVLCKASELSFRNSTFQSLLEAAAARHPAGTTISSVYTRGKKTQLVSAMKNAPLLDDFRVEGTFLLRGKAPAGVYLLPFEALALVASHFALAIYVGKIKSEGGRSDGVVQASAVYKAIADCGIAVGRPIFSATQELVTEILAADLGASFAASAPSRRGASPALRPRLRVSRPFAAHCCVRSEAFVLFSARRRTATRRCSGKSSSVSGARPRNRARSLISLIM